MRLAETEVIPYALPFRTPYVTARGRLRRREMILLRLREEGGAVGLGEAVPLSLRGGETLAQVVGELRSLAAAGALAAAVGSGSAPQAGLSPPARCAVETALWDLRERAAAKPQGDGTSARGGIPCNATLVAGEPGAVAEQALSWLEAGFRTFKLKLGTGCDIAQVEAVREAVGPGPRIRLDANGAWSLAEARRALAALEPLDIELVEQPVATVAEAAELAAETAIPLAGDESVASPGQARLARRLGAFRLTGIKLSKVGGANAAREIAAILPAYLSSALDGPVGIAAAARVAATLRGAGGPDLAHGLATQRLFATTVARTECELRDGSLWPPAGPGLGVEIDDDALASQRLE